MNLTKAYVPRHRSTAVHNNLKGVQRVSRPLANIVEHESDFIIQLATPGFKRENLGLNVKNGVLEITGRIDQSDDVSNYARKEFEAQPFTKRFRLHEAVDANKVSAQYSDGVLSVTLPKREEERKREISIL